VTAADALVYAGILALPPLVALALWRVARRAGVVAVNVLVFLLAASVLYAAAETYYRFVYDTTDSFALMRTSEDWWTRHSRANRMIVRDDIEYAMARTPGRPRVTFLGDSFTAGHGIKDVHDRFVNRIRAARPAWDVHALARPGLDTGGEIRFLQDVLRQGYQLDTVVLVYCLNDISDIVPEWNAILDRIKRGGSGPGFFAEHSYFANVLFWRLSALRNPDVANYYGFVRSAYAGPIWDRQMQRLRQVRDIVRGAGGRFAVVTFPFLHALGSGYEHRDVHRRLDAFWHGLGVPHLDLLPVLEAHADEPLVVNRFDAHPNERASALAAGAILPFVDGLVAPQ
jgi:lysophospholipase L1-like esterase